jgi:hypothetical protein
MSERQYRIIGGVRIGPNQKLWYRLDALDAWTPITLNPTGPSVYYPTSNSESFDLTIHIGNLLAAESAEIILDISTVTGLVSVDRGALSYLELSSRLDGGASKEDNSDNVWAILFPQLAATGVYNLVLTGGDQSYTTDGPHGFSLYPRRYFLRDVTAHRFRAAQNVSIGGRANTNFVSRLLQPMIDVRLVGSYPRALVLNEYHQLSDFLALAATGMPVLVYPDRTVYTPYAELTNPYGWWRGVLLRDSGDFDPQRADGEWFANWHKAMVFQNIGSPQ